MIQITSDVPKVSRYPGEITNVRVWQNPEYGFTWEIQVTVTINWERFSVWARRIFDHLDLEWALIRLHITPEQFMEGVE